jgi:hypothetical protein
MRSSAAATRRVGSGAFAALALAAVFLGGTAGDVTITEEDCTCLTPVICGFFCCGNVLCTCSLRCVGSMHAMSIVSIAHVSRPCTQVMTATTEEQL